jgi:hypothetical protein
VGFVPVMDRYPPVNAETRGKLRVWKHRTEATSQRIDKAASRLADQQFGLIEALVFKRGKGRDRAAHKIMTMLKGAQLDAARLDGNRPLLVFSRIRMSKPLFVEPIDPGETQNCAVIDYLLVGAGPNETAGISDGLWTLQVTEHALQRALQRNRRDADLTEVLFDAHRNLLCVPRALVPDRDEFFLPAGDGVFVCRMVLGSLADHGLHQHAYARTWLHNDQLHDNQTPVSLTGPYPSLGDGCLLPMPLRKIDDSTYVITPVAPFMPELLHAGIGPAVVAA